MTTKGENLGADVGIFVIFLIFALIIVILSLAPAALGLLMLGGTSEARVVLIVVGLVVLALGSSAGNIPVVLTGVLILAAVVLAYLPSSRAHFSG
ncbi:hypothetical protein [Leifsonia sp. ZF2019]|uniref:hypothetical protein n=1 Tax=Leifsonia sp. ZF2019 TaxID=2781978 RepID=UPI001CBBB31A|nr:hypothetical protein [Leifsonia sp. ZF2019]